MTPWTAARQASLSITNSQSLLKLMSIESVMPSNHLILCRPLLLPPSIFPSIGLFQGVSSSHQVAKVLEFQLQHQSFQRIFRTDSFRMDWLDLLVVQGTLKSPPTPQFKSISVRTEVKIHIGLVVESLSALKLLSQCLLVT